MAKKSKVSVDDFVFFDEEETQPLKIIAKSIQKTDIFHESKLSRNEAKVEPLHESKLSRSEAKVEPDLSGKIKVEPKVEPQPEPLHESKLSRSEAKVEPIGAFESLVGLQRDALIFIFDSCLNSGSKISGSITISNLAISLKSTVAAARKAIQRLEQKGYLLRSQFKDGRGGWTKYALPQGVYSDLLTIKTKAKVEPNMSQTRAKVSTQPEPQPEPNVPYSSSNLNINTNTTGSEFLSIPENLHRFGISLINLKNLVSSGKATKEVVERSLVALSFDVEQGKAGNLANILFGVLRSGKEYVSQKQAEQLSKELEFELNRIREIEDTHQKLTETRLKARYREFLEKTPNYLNEVKKRHSGLLSDNSDLLEKIAFEEFKHGDV